MPNWPVSNAVAPSNIYSMLVPKRVAFTATITDASQTETSAFRILTITPDAVAPLVDVEVWLDLAKATTGFAAVESSITAQFAVARKLDGTNWRREAYNEAALSGTNAANRMQKLTVGAVTAEELAAVFAVFSSDVTADIVIPGLVIYKGLLAPTVA